MLKRTVVTTSAVMVLLAALAVLVSWGAWWPVAVLVIVPSVTLGAMALLWRPMGNLMRDRKRIALIGLLPVFAVAAQGCILYSTSIGPIISGGFNLDGYHVYEVPYLATTNLLIDALKGCAQSGPPGSGPEEHCWYNLAATYYNQEPEYSAILDCNPYFQGMCDQTRDGAIFEAAGTGNCVQIAFLVDPTDPFNRSKAGYYYSFSYGNGAGWYIHPCYG